MSNSVLLFRDITAVSFKSASADHITAHIHIHMHIFAYISTSEHGELYTMIFCYLHYCLCNINTILLTPGICNIYRHRSSDINFPFIFNTCSVVLAILCFDLNSFIFYLISSRFKLLTAPTYNVDYGRHSHFHVPNSFNSRTMSCLSFIYFIFL